MVADARMLDLVTELMRKGHGQMHILKRIKRAASQNEVISVNERKYVESLTEKFLRASQKKEPPKSIAEPILMQQVKPAPQERVLVKKTSKNRISSRAVSRTCIQIGKSSHGHADISNR